MKVALVYPPITKDGKYPLLSQNRHFRYSSSLEVRIYPVVFASAATLLYNDGNDVLYLDGINERLNMQEFMRQVEDFNPELVVLETKAPIITKHWEFINKIKEKHTKWKVALVGDHVSCFPKESFEKSSVDFVIVGGDYDITLLNLVNFLKGKGKIPNGIFYKNEKEILSTGRWQKIENLDSLPFINRDITKWNIYGEAYLYHPCAYIITGRGCGCKDGTGGICTFCIWQFAFWNAKPRLRTPKNVVEEIKMLVEKYKIIEIFDDNESGAMWNKEWLKEFYKEMKYANLIGKVIISSNARADALIDDEVCELLKNSGFRLLKIGLESGNDETLKRIRKKETITEIIKGVKNAKDHGLITMLTVMVGYPWETEEMVRKTFEISKELLLYKTHCGDCLQASVIIAYPGTPLHSQAKSNNWFAIDPYDYSSYDMSKPLLKSQYDPNYWCDKIWTIHLNPKFIMRTLFTIKSWHDIKLLYRGVKSLFGHKKDF